MERDSYRVEETRKELETQKAKVQSLCQQRYQQLLKIEERQQQVELLLAEKGNLIRHRNELLNLLKDVESNIQPTQFKNKVGGSSSEEF